MLYHYHLEMFNTFEQGASYFHFALGLTSYAAGLVNMAYYFLTSYEFLLKCPLCQEAFLCLPHLKLQIWPQISNLYYPLLCDIFLHSTCIFLLCYNFHLHILFIICPL